VICSPEFPACTDREDFVFYGLHHVAGVTTATADSTWFAAASADCAYDWGTFRYGGTLLLAVPPGATGTYNVALVDDPDFTVMNTCLGPSIGDLNLTYARITIVTGRCCSNIGTATTVCEEDLLEAECETRPEPRVFTPLASCTGADVSDCNDNGLPDECDIAGDISEDCNANGIPDECESDDDGDGVINECDSCPLDPNKVEPGLCGCGVDDDADSDGDSVPDCIDECPGMDDAVFAPGCGDVIPTTSHWGMVILGLFLLVVAKVYFRRRRVDALV
jgi:hypothetical protein